MNNNKVWAYYIYLSAHMWDDEYTAPRGWYIGPRYQENNGTDLETWDRMVQYLAQTGYNMLLIDVGDGIQYESRPEISAPDAWSKDLLRQKLNEARALGLEPIPKLNFSCGHHTWLKQYRRMVSTPEYYAACADVIREVLEVFDYPRLIHFGMDEENWKAPVTLREMYITRGEQLWWHDMFFYFAQAEKYGAQPWVWSDYYWHHSESFLKHMPKSAVQSNWYYGNFRQYPEGDLRNKRISTYEELDAHGYIQIPTMSNCRGYDGAAVNCYQTLVHTKTKLKDENIMGFLQTGWRATTPINEFYLKDAAIYLYDARKQVYPETLK